MAEVSASGPVLGRYGYANKNLGPTGGQVRDYYREDYDEGRGGYGGKERELMRTDRARSRD